jgi:hypothetical protein
MEHSEIGEHFLPMDPHSAALPAGYARRGLAATLPRKAPHISVFWRRAGCRARQILIVFSP